MFTISSLAQRMVHSIGAGLTLLAAGVTLAAEAPSQLPTVEVIGSVPLPGLNVPRSQLPGNVQTADDAQINQSGAGGLAQFLHQNFSGLSVNEVQGNPYRIDVLYRGFRLSPTLGAAQGLSVFLDGVRINEAFGDVMNWDLVPEAALAGVTLVPGSNPLYGLNTLGGALVLTTKSGLTHAGTEVELGAGSFGRARVELNQGRTLGEGWHAFVSATAYRESGWREQSPSDLGNLYVKFGRSLGATDWTLSLARADSRTRGNGLVPDELIVARRSVLYTFPDTTRSASTLVSLAAQQRLDAERVASGVAYVRTSSTRAQTGDLNGDYVDFVDACKGAAPPCDPSAAPATALLNQSFTRQRSAGLNLALAQHSGSHKFVVGAAIDASRVSYRQTTQQAGFTADREVVADAGSVLEEQARLDGSSSTASVYATDTVALGERTHVTASARWNQTRVRNHLVNLIGDTDETFRYAKLNPALGATQQVGDGFTLFANASQGTRVPTAIELGCADAANPCVLPTGLQSDPYLKQVVSRTLEAGLRWTPGEGSRFNLTLYRIANRDDIVFVRAQASQFGYFVNIPRTRNQGLELAWRQRLSAASSLRINYGHLDATYQFDGELNTPLEQAVQVRRGTRVAGIPRELLNLGLETRLTGISEGLRVSLDAQFSSSRRIAGNEDGALTAQGAGFAKTGGYGLVNLRVNHEIAPGLEWLARVSNLLNRRYETYAQLNRSLFPGGALVQPGDAPGVARFVAPGAPRSLWVGLRVAWR